MQRKSYNLEIPQKYREIANKINFWSPVSRNGWIIKFSVHDNTNILLFFISQHTGQTLIRYFTDENDAVKFINFLCNQDSSERLEGDENPA
jgi:hypothetical protein